MPGPVVSMVINKAMYGWSLWTACGHKQKRQQHRHERAGAGGAHDTGPAAKINISMDINETYNPTEFPIMDIC